VPRRRHRLRARQQRHVFVDTPRQGRRDLDAARALRQQLAEFLAFAVIRADDDLLLARQRFADGLRVHVGRAFHVAAHPRAEADHRRRIEIRDARAVELLEGGRDLLVECRHDAVHHLGEIEDRVLALVGDGEALPRMFLGLPAGRDLGAQPALQVTHLLRLELRVQPVEQDAGHALLAAQLRAARGFGGVRDEDRFESQRRQQVEHLVERHALRAQLRQRILDAARLRPPAVGDEVFPAPSHAVDPLRDVHGLEPCREGAHEVPRLRRWPSGNAHCELVGAGLRAFPPGDGLQAVVLDQIEQRLSTLLAQHLPEHHAELVHVLAQGEMLGGEFDLVAMHAGAFYPPVARRWHPAPRCPPPHLPARSPPASPSRRRAPSCSPARGCSPNPCTSRASTPRR
jgi:hypothetical protein